MAHDPDFQVFAATMSLVVHREEVITRFMRDLFRFNRLVQYTNFFLRHHPRAETLPNE